MDYTKFYRFYNHKRAVKYCSKNIFAIRAWYSAAIPLLVVELIGVIFMSIPLALLVRNLNFGLMIAGIVVNTMVIYPALLCLVLYKSITVSYVVDIAVELNGPPIAVLKDACINGMKYPEFYELVCALMENGHINGYKIVGGGLLVKNGIVLTDTEVKEYLGLKPISKAEKSKAPKRIVYDLSGIDVDDACDNCGKPFEYDDSFCGFCGTARKDIRRRV